MPLPIMAGIALAGGVASIIQRSKANKDMRRLMASNPAYKANPLVADNLGYAKTLLNARMPGAATMENNIAANKASSISNINKAATDSSTALALASGAQGQADDQFQRLGLEENQDFQRRYNNVNSAITDQVGEDDKVFNDSVRRFGNNVEFQGAINQNRANNVSEATNMAMGLANFGMAGGMGGMFGGGGGGNATYTSHINNPSYRLPASNLPIPQNPVRRSMF